MLPLTQGLNYRSACDGSVSTTLITLQIPQPIATSLKYVYWSKCSVERYGAEPPAESTGRAPGPHSPVGTSPPEAENYFASGHSTDLQSLSVFSISHSIHGVYSETVVLCVLANFKQKLTLIGILQRNSQMPFFTAARQRQHCITNGDSLSQWRCEI